MSHTTTVKSVPIRDIAALQAAVQELHDKGINLTLERNAVPRMFYKDQLQKHLGQSSETCDYVIKIHDADYDIGLLKQDDGSYTPVFDDWRQSIAKQVGAPFAGKVEHWSGAKDDTEQTLHSIGQIIQSYTKHATINAAVSSGYVVEGTVEHQDGSIELIVGGIE